MTSSSSIVVSHDSFRKSDHPSSDEESMPTLTELYEKKKSNRGSMMSMYSNYSVDASVALKLDEIDDLDNFFSVVESEEHGSSKKWKTGILLGAMFVMLFALGVGVGILFGSIWTKLKEEELNNNIEVQSLDDVHATAVGATTNDDNSNTLALIVVPPAPLNLPTLCGMNSSKNLFSECIEVCGMASCCWMSDKDEYCFHENIEICSEYNPCLSSAERTGNHKEEIPNIDGINNGSNSVLNIDDDDTP